MSNPDIGYIVLRGGLVETKPEEIPFFDMDVLETDDEIVLPEVSGLYAALAEYREGREEDTYDYEYLSGLMAECKVWAERRHLTLMENPEEFAPDSYTGRHVNEN